MSYFGLNNNGNYGGFNQNGYGGINYQPPTQQTNYGLKSGLQYASKAEMEALFIAPNTQVMAFGKEGDVFYIKTCDELGRSSMSVFDYKRHEDVQENVVKEEYLTKKEAENFVKTQDLDALVEKLKEIENKITVKGVVENGYKSDNRKSN